MNQKPRISHQAKQRSLYWYEVVGIVAVSIAVYFYVRDDIVLPYLKAEQIESIKIDILKERLFEAERRAFEAEEAIKQTAEQIELLDKEQIQIQDAVRGLSLEVTK